MKNYTIGLLIVIIITMGSFIVKYQTTKVAYNFTIPESLMKSPTDKILYIFLYFSKNRCISCIMEVNEFLNTLPPQFCCAGIVPEEELKDETGLRRATGVSFPLYSSQKFQKCLPGYKPTLLGVSPSGKIIFALPIVMGQIYYLRHILASMYGKFYPSAMSMNSIKEINK